MIARNHALLGAVVTLLFLSSCLPKGAKAGASVKDESDVQQDTPDSIAEAAGNEIDRIDGYTGGEAGLRLDDAEETDIYAVAGIDADNVDAASAFAEPDALSSSRGDIGAIHDADERAIAADTGPAQLRLTGNNSRRIADTTRAQLQQNRDRLVAIRAKALLGKAAKQDGKLPPKGSKVPGKSPGKQPSPNGGGAAAISQKGGKVDGAAGGVVDGCGDAGAFGQNGGCTSGKAQKALGAGDEGAGGDAQAFSQGE